MSSRCLTQTALKRLVWWLQVYLSFKIDLAGVVHHLFCPADAGEEGEASGSFKEQVDDC